VSFIRPHALRYWFYVCNFVWYELNDWLQLRPRYCAIYCKYRISYRVFTILILSSFLLKKFYATTRVQNIFFQFEFVLENPNEYSSIRRSSNVLRSTDHVQYCCVRTTSRTHVQRITLALAPGVCPQEFKHDATQRPCHVTRWRHSRHVTWCACRVHDFISAQARGKARALWKVLYAHHRCRHHHYRSAWTAALRTLPL